MHHSPMMYCYMYALPNMVHHYYKAVCHICTNIVNVACFVTRKTSQIKVSGG